MASMSTLDLYLERFTTMTLDLYVDTDRAVFVWKWSTADRGRQTVGEYKLADMRGAGR